MLAASRVGVVGMGALGTVIADQLVRAGVGRVKIIDRDFVEYSNLQRQTLFDEDDVRSNLPKAVAASATLPLCSKWRIRVLETLAFCPSVSLISLPGTITTSKLNFCPSSFSTWMLPLLP